MKCVHEQSVQYMGKGQKGKRGLFKCAKLNKVFNGFSRSTRYVHNPKIPIGIRDKGLGYLRFRAEPQELGCSLTFWG